MTQLLEDFVRFIHRSPTAYHTAREIANRLAEADFTPLTEQERWKLELGKGYFVMRQDVLVAAFRIPKKVPHFATVLASHTDSPALKIKPHPELSSHGIGQFGTEVYGGPLLHSWFDRDLAVAGRITVQINGKCHSKVVYLDDYPLIIPQLAIHLDRSINEKGILVHKQDHLKAIFSINSKEKHFETWLKKHHPFDHLLGFDLFLVPTEKPTFLGFENELIASYRLDNLTSVYASLYAMVKSKTHSDGIQMAIFWDNEEVGSTSYVGADSLFANQVLERICSQFKMDREDYYRLKSRSLCLSGDLAHGFHPNYADKYDPQNSPYLGKGVILKFNANQKYATTGPAAAPLVHLAAKEKIPLQQFASRSDIPSGSTVGPIMSANLGIPTVDLGIAGWAMHSTREVIAAKDQQDFCHFLKAALEEPLLPVEES
ncbi:MAG TPA: M18 family aminopeptidase [Chlamydiales bacterium]|nr:M18 family aminopeptidase [Chlamydiales bacterium]